MASVSCALGPSMASGSSSLPVEDVCDPDEEDALLEFRQVTCFMVPEGSGKKVHRLVIWGGTVNNTGESQLSLLVDRSAHCLRSMTYCPDRTKGGVLIRPKYYQRDRAGVAHFPRLTDLSIRLEPVLLPRYYGWLCPGLLRLRLLCVLRTGSYSGRRVGLSQGSEGREPVRMPTVQALQEWIGSSPAAIGSAAAQRGSAPLAQLLLQDCPSLESITIALCSTNDLDSCDQADWITLLPPKPIPWRVHRLLLLPSVEASRSGGAGEGNEVVPAPLSTLSRLTPRLVDVVLGFLGRRRWEHRREEISASEAERLRLMAKAFAMPLPEILQGGWSQ